MSGGSFNYLYTAWDFDTLEQRRMDIEDMAKALRKLGEKAEVAAKATESIIALLDQVNDQARKLSDVWHDMEWWYSNDYSEDQVDQSLAKFAKEHGQ